MIKLRFVTGKGFISKAIRQVTWSPFSHVEFVVPEGYLGAHFKDGVQIRPEGYDHKGMTAEIFGTVECDHHVADKVLEFAYNQVGKKYDTGAIWGILSHRDIFDDEKWFCSELVCAAFHQAGLPLLNLSKVNRVTPGMLLISPHVVYDIGFPLARPNFELRF